MRLPPAVRKSLAGCLVYLSYGFLSITCYGADPEDPKLAKARDAQVGKALVKGYRILETAVENYPEHRKCFSCHHQTLPLLALSLKSQMAKRSPNFLDSNTTRSIIDLTTDSFSKKREELLEGRKFDGGALAVGYGLWTFEIARVKPNETTRAMVEHLLNTQADDGSWDLDSIRPPALSSRAMATALAFLGIKKFGVNGGVEKERIRSALLRAANWGLDLRNPSNHEELLGAIWLNYLSHTEFRINETGVTTNGTADEDSNGRFGNGFGQSEAKWDITDDREPVQAVLKILLRESQRDDGGWSQTDELQSDPYSTGMAMMINSQARSRYHRKGYANRKRDVTNSIDEMKAVDFLLKSQELDGSWHVKSRAIPIRTFFDNGDPHGKDQFISIMATSWAVAALANFQGQHFSPLDEIRN